MEPYQQLEVEWAKFNDLDPAGMVACSSGTAALHLALEAMQLPPGSEVITGDFNMIAVPRAIAMAGLTPVFVDCDERLLMDLKLVQSWYRGRQLMAEGGGLRMDHNYRTAIVLVHVYGRRCGIDLLKERDEKADYASVLDSMNTPSEVKETFLIEDLAEAHGVRPHPETDAACWSFFKNKIVAGEEGGAVWFRDPEHAKLARQLRSMGFTDAHDYTHVPRGHNYRMSNLHANVIIKSLQDYHDYFTNPKVVHVEKVEPRMESVGMMGNVVEGNASLRRQIEGWYDEFCPPEWRMPARDAVWVYDLKIPTSAVTYCNDITDKQYGYPSYMRLNVIVEALQKQGIAARHGFKPMSRQREFKDCRRVLGPYTRTDTSKADLMSCRVLYLPVQPGRTTRDDCRRAFQVIREALPPAG